MSSPVGFSAGVDSGENAYERCALCHGLYGVTPRAKFPILAGQNPVYLSNQLQAFIDGRRHNDGGQMQGVVTEISQDQITEVVAWFSSQELPKAQDDNSLGDSKGGALQFTENGCASCHLENQTAEEAVPLLYAQHPAYLAKQMREFRDGLRETEGNTALHRQLSALSDSQITSIAQYLASQENKP